jgi:hypothetical protein
VQVTVGVSGRYGFHQFVEGGFIVFDCQWCRWLFSIFYRFEFNGVGFGWDGETVLNLEKTCFSGCF